MQIQRLPDSLQLLVQATENLYLLFFRTVDEILSEYIPAVKIYAVQGRQKTRYLIALIPLGENEIDELIYPHGFRSRGIGLRDDELADRCHRRVLVRVQRLQRGGFSQLLVNLAKKRKCVTREDWESGSRS